MYPWRGERVKEPVFFLLRTGAGEIGFASLLFFHVEGWAEACTKDQRSDNSARIGHLGASSTAIKVTKI